MSLPFKVVSKEFDSKAHARVWMRSNQAGRRNLSDAWRIELGLGNKVDLAAIGTAKRKQTQGRPSKETVVRTDNSFPKHDTRKEIADAAGVSTGKVAKAEIVKREAPSYGKRPRRKK